jgi:hypothetical protein
MPTVEAGDAVEKAAFVALSGNAALTALSPVYQHPPEQLPFPLTMIGNIEEDPEPFGTKGDDDDVRAHLAIVVGYQGKQRKPVTAIERQVKASLKGLDVADQDGWRLAFRFIGKEGVGPGDDGVTYESHLRFEVDCLSNG